MSIWVISLLFYALRSVDCAAISSSIESNAQKLNSQFYSIFAGPQPAPKLRPFPGGGFRWKLGRSSVTSIDLLFVMDNSGSIPSADFTKQKAFVAMMIDHALTIGCHNSVRVAVITFAAQSQTKIEFDFNDHSTGTTPRASLKIAVNSIPYVGGWATNTNEALNLAHTLLNDVSRGARNGATKVVFVLTDGKSNQGGNPETAADVLKTSDGATVFAMGVANFQSASSQQELLDIATSSNHVLVVEDFDDMDDIVGQFGPKARCNLIDMAQNRPEDWNSIIEGFKTLKQNGAINDLAALHEQTFMQFGSSHSGAGFLPWHRAYLTMIERALQIARSDNSLRLPYWDWAGEDASTSSIWTHLGGSQNGDPSDGFCVNTGHFKKSDWHPDPSECITRNIMSPSPGTAQASQSQLNSDRNLSPYETFRQTTESGGNRHNHLHVQFGFQSDMITGESPRDPVFYFHHCFIDRLWYDWQQQHGEGPSNYPAAGEVYNLNTPMNQLSASYPGTATPLLANSNWNRPVNLLKVTDLGYTYEDTSGSIFQGKRRKRGIVFSSNNAEQFETVQQPEIVSSVFTEPSVTKPEVSAPDALSVAKIKSTLLLRHSLSSLQVQQLKADTQCMFLSDRLSASDLNTCVRRRTTPGVRIASGPNRFEGRAEILIYGTWHSICDYGWDNTDASVFCRQLGFSEGKAIAHKESRWLYKYNRNLVTNVHCLGTEKLLQDCKLSRTSGNGYCEKFAYAQVQCTPGVRLTAEGRTSGYLQVYDASQNRWGAVCGAKNWGNRQRSAACEAAGYGPAYPLRFVAKIRKPASQVTDYRCLFSNKKNIDCLVGIQWERQFCSNFGDRLYLSCQRAVRLVGGSGAHEGRVEVFHNGVWGTVCGQSWDIADANVVCRQLGFSLGAETAYRGRYPYGHGSGVIWLSYVNCRGMEASLDRCKHSGWGSAARCSHYHDAGVKCRKPVIRIVPPITPVREVDEIKSEIRT